ncbi:hypothetical protein VPH35_055168 [Triticum aestivum]|uniref:uncharacterized protein n=1 Tax=Triticum aestivum TaxID=4565 RepID=UPI001D02480E|nr:uncharacterized protein LOC123072207 [Triticum aestivum]
MDAEAAAATAATATPPAPSSQPLGSIPQPPPPPPPPSSVVHTPLPLQTAPPVASFPSAAYIHAMRVESAHINLGVRLDMKGANYSTWRGLMLEVIDQYDVAAWIAPDFTNRAGDVAWNIVNKAVKRWFYGSMVTELAGFVLNREATAAELWSSIESLFVNNRRSRRFQLTAELFAVKQGDAPVSSFCARLKAVADGLRNAGKVLDDDELVVQLLRGVNKDRHEMTAKIIEKSQTPVPFDVAVGMLLQDEIGADFSPSGVSHTALAVQQHPPAPASSSGGHARPPVPGQGGPKPGTPSPNQGNNKRRRYTNNDGYQGAANSPPPWTGHVYAYPVSLPPPPRPQGILGPRPAQAYTAYAPLQYGGVPSGPTGYGGRRMVRYRTRPPLLAAPPQPHRHHTTQALDGVDQAALMGALHNQTLQNSTNGWIADSGASSHITSDPGLHHQGGAAPMQQ